MRLQTLALAALAATAVAGCWPRHRPNVLLVTIDTLRADRVGCYGFALAQTPAAQAALSRLGAASGQLSLLKNQLSGVPISGLPSNQPGTSRAGSGKGTGRGKSYALGTGARKGQGTGAQRGLGRGSQPGQGQGKGSAQATGTGRGSGKGQGNPQGQYITSGAQGTSGARGSGGRGRAGTSRSGRYVTVYVPAREGKGAQTIQNGPNGAAAPGSIVPYHQVIGQYTQTAHRALDRTTLPSSLRSYVRRYFGTLSQ